MHVFPYVEMSIGFLNLKNRVEIYICMYIILLPAFPLGWSRQLVRVSVVLVGQEGGDLTCTEEGRRADLGCVRGTRGSRPRIAARLRVGRRNGGAGEWRVEAGYCLGKGSGRATRYDPPAADRPVESQRLGA